MFKWPGTPTYLSELLTVKRFTYNTRASASNKSLLQVPFVKNKTFAVRSFSVAAPSLWNNLPEEVQNCPSVVVFKKHLKTYLFTRTFE